MRTLELSTRTPPGWAAHALTRPLELLADHAWCELGAAAAAQGLVARHPDVEALPRALVPLAIEELRHFRRVERSLRERGGALGAARRNPYAERLLAGVERGQGLLDRLLVAACIEARSLERFLLLAEAAEDAGLAALYAELAVAESAHASLFLELAHELFPAELVAARRARWIAREARTIQGLPRASRIHSGWLELLPRVEERQHELRPEAAAGARPGVPT